MEFVNKQYMNSKLVSWEHSLFSLFAIQKRIYKSYLVGDFRRCLFFQKLVLQSSYSRLLAIREVTQLSSFKKVPGIDGKTFLTFTERFELNELLKLKINNWHPTQIKNVSVLKKNGSVQVIKLFTISDRVWQLIVSYSVQPVYEFSFHPHVFGFRTSSNIFDLQKFFSLNFSYRSGVLEKRVLLINLQGVFTNFKNDLILEKLILPRGVKLGLFRSFNLGFCLEFPDQITDKLNLNSLLANVVLNWVTFIHPSVRFGYDLLFILKPLDNEKYIFNKIIYNLKLNNLNHHITCLGVYSILSGFNFLDWNYVFSLKNGLIITPNFKNYQQFLFRIKRVLNNSNYGSGIKASKLSFLVKEWRVYNRFCSLSSNRLSLFYLKKRAFKIFNKEAKQDFYSSKKLLEKSFLSILAVGKNFLEIEKEKSPYFGHLVFDYYLIFNKIFVLKSFSFKPGLFCIHCGLNSFFSKS